MNRPTERKTVQSSILAYAQEIGWRYVYRAEAEKRRSPPITPALGNCSMRCSTSCIHAVVTLARGERG